MKKFLLPLLVSLVLIFAGVNVNAQIAADNEHLLAQGLRHVITVEPITAPLLAENNVSVKVMRDFEKSFKNAEATKWYKTPQGQMAYFTDHGIQSRAVYNNKGNWVYNMRSYNEQDLSKEIRTRVKTVYFDYSITRVNEITVQGRIFYFVRMEDAKRCITVRVCAEEDMDETESFLK